MPRFAKRRSASVLKVRPRAARLETLEPRLVMYSVSGYAWSNPNVSFSFVPDGAKVEGYENALFSKLNAVAPTAVWQREFARALQTWANATNLNFHQVIDSGLSSGTIGAKQGDTRFGDIRLAAHALGGPLAYAYYPSGGSNTITGDIFLATEHAFQVGADYDLFSVLLHEAGHSLGLQHAAGSVMNSTYQGVLGGLTADDVAGIQAIYGARQKDSFDAAASNDQRSTATAMTVASDGKRTATADLQSLADVDYFRFTAPQTATGTFSVAVSSAGLSLLAPRLEVYNAAGLLLGSAASGSEIGTKVAVNLTGVVAGEVLYVMADGATSDAFGMGRYQLEAGFGVTSGGGTPAPPPPSPPSISPDPYEANDMLAQATNLGRFNSKTVGDATLHSAADVDCYRFSVHKGGSFRISTQFDGSSQSQITVYNGNGGVIAQSTAGTVTVSLASNAMTFVRVSSPSGAVDAYDLAFERIGNAVTGGSGNLAGGKLTPDGYYAEGVGHHDGDDDSDDSESSYQTPMRDLVGSTNAGAQAESQPRIARGAGGTSSAAPAALPHFSQLDAAFAASWQQDRGAMRRIPTSAASQRRDLERDERGAMLGQAWTGPAGDAELAFLF